MLQIYEKIADNVAQKRVFLIFLGLLLLQTLAFAQNDSKITIQQKNITVIDALKTVEKQSKMSINYSDSELTGKVIAQLNLQNASLETALDTILKGTGFSFQIQGNRRRSRTDDDESARGKTGKQNSDAWFRKCRSGRILPADAVRL